MPLNGIVENLLPDLGRQSFERDGSGRADSAPVDESLNNSAIFDIGVLDLGFFDGAILDAAIDGQAIVHNRGVDGRIDHDAISQDDISINVALVQYRVDASSTVQCRVLKITVYVDLSGSSDHELLPDPTTVFEVNLAWHDCPVHVYQDAEQFSRG
jgi:hypothetical protein